jgi:hypothetical protein
MSFSYSSGVITQTGTDTDLSGLTGLTGVTVTSYSGRYAVYALGTNRLDIEGDLTINPEENMFISNASTGTVPNMAVNVRNGATLTLGVKTTVGTANKYTTGTAFICAEQGSLNTDGSLNVESGATLQAYGATIQMAGPTRVRAGATLTVEDLTLVNCRRGSCQFRIEAQSVADVALVSISENGMTLNGATSNDSCRLTTSGNNNPFNSDAFIFNFVRAQYQPAAGGYPPQVFLNFDNGNNVDSADFAYAGSGGSPNTQFDGDLVDFRNVARRLRYTNANNNSGFCKTTKNVNFILRDASGTGLNTISYYAIDVDNGSRINSNGFDSTADIVYSGQNAGPTLALNITAEFMAGQSTTQLVDSRTNADDTILFRFISYTTNITESSPVLIGLRDLNSVIVNATDASITETNTTTVDAYTEIDTSRKFYDKAKLLLVNSYTGESSTIVSRSGNEINAGSFNVVIDASASSVASISGNTVTIKATEYIGDITTTGTITLLNGASFIGNLTDSTGTRTITTLTLTGLQSNSEVRVFDAGTTTEVAGVENSGTSFTTNIAVSSVDIVVHNLSYEYLKIEGADTSADLTLPIQQRFDRNYENA